MSFGTVRTVTPVKGKPLDETEVLIELDGSKPGTYPVMVQRWQFDDLKVVPVPGLRVKLDYGCGIALVDAQVLCWKKAGCDPAGLAAEVPTEETVADGSHI